MALVLFQQIVVMFLMLGMGFALVKAKVFRAEDSRVLSIMAIYIIAPCVIIRSFQIDFTPEVRNGFLMTVAAAVLINVCLLFLTGLYQKIFRLDAVERASVMYANTGNLVIPLVMSIFGDEWVVYASAAMCVQLAFMWTHANHIISGEKGVHWKKILTNVNLVSIAIGLALLLTGIRLPALVQEALAQMSATMGPVNMVMLGMLLAAVKWREVLSKPRIYLVTGLKMLLSPLILLPILRVSGLTGWVPEGRTLMYISFMAVMTPTAATITQLAQMYRNEPEYASAINAVTTLTCIATMPLMTVVFGWVMG